ncbi:cell envelope integrity protein CreD [Hyphococcus formosus]|uniref:cell envelope integrity protein CreD n=1 Tax=Hyphococcus formosus TaxID=3143534 RepID=UPI00398A6DAE
MNINETFKNRSLGLKLILVGALAFLLWIPAMLVYGLVFERSTRAESVKQEIYQLAGGEQTISGPLIIVPAVIETDKLEKFEVPVKRTQYFAFTPQSLDIDSKISATQRRRSIYDATIYDADIKMKGQFSTLVPPAIADGEAKFDWQQAVLAIKFRDDTALKGIRDNLSVKINGREHKAPFEPGISLTVLESGRRGDNISLPGISMMLPITDPSATIEFELALPMSGGGALQFAPAGEDTSVSMHSDWPDPSFQGAYLPDSREITDQGFTAQWRIPYLARNLPRSFPVEGNLGFLDQGKSFGVSFVSAASPYKSVNRALKYSLMFLGVVFLTFFLFEATTDARAHPAQYILLGLTQVIFYLMVLAFSEHIGFDAAFAVTAVATVSLSGAYAATVFHSKMRGIIAFAAFSAAYGLIYLLMKSEDYALLIGSVTAFGAIALTMFVTRRLDWYGGRDKA